MATIDKRTLKAFIRYDGQGRLVPNSLILRKSMPKVGKWLEVLTNRCCNLSTTTTTSTTIASYPCVTYGFTVGKEGAFISYIDCGGDYVESEMNPYAEDSVCAQEGTLYTTGDIEVVYLGECTTTTTTSSSTTTTTTTQASTTTTTTSSSTTTTTSTTESPTTTTTTTGG
jgi:hypothetical protein